MINNKTKILVKCKQPRKKQGEALWQVAASYSHRGTKALPAGLEWQAELARGRVPWIVQRGICERLRILNPGCHGALNSVAAGSLCLGQGIAAVNKVTGSVSLLLVSAASRSC